MSYSNRVFKIIPANKEDYKKIEYLLKSRTFYPTNIPPTFSSDFDYRQLFVYMFPTENGFLVYTREETTDTDFGIDYIPTADWTNKYYCSVAPTIELYNYTDIVNARRTMTGVFIFKSWDYQLYNN